MFHVDLVDSLFSIPQDMSSLTSEAPRHTGLRVGKRPTLNDIARDLGISRATVSNAFNRPDVVAPPLLEKILAHSQSLGYGGPDPMARAMRRREVQEVAVVFHHDLRYALGDAQSVQFLQGVASELDRRHLSLQLIPKMGRRALLPAAFQTTADALIIHDQVESGLQMQLRMVHKPVVLVDTYLEGMASVGLDDLQGARLAMQHVLSVNPDRVAVMCLPVGESERARIDQSPYGTRSGFVGGARYGGYLQVLLEARFPLDRVIWMEVDDRMPEQAVQLSLIHISEPTRRS